MPIVKIFTVVLTLIISLNHLTMYLEDATYLFVMIPLIEVAFPEQETRYVQATIKQKTKI